MKNDKYDSRHQLTHPQGVIPQVKQLAGSTKAKFPVVLDGGRTIIFIDDKTKEAETIERYKKKAGYRSY